MALKRVFPSESALFIRWPKYWSFSFNISTSNEHPGLISFRMEWLDLLPVQWTLKSLLQHHSSKASILQHSALFMVQLSYSYVTTGKTIALTIQAFVEKVMSLLFNMLSRFFLPSLLFPSLPFPSLFFLHLCPSLSLFFFLTPTCNCSQYREAKCTDEKTLLGYNLSLYKTQSPMEKLPPILWAHMTKLCTWTWLLVFLAK